MIAPIWVPLYHTDMYWYEVPMIRRDRFSMSWTLAREMARSWDRSWDASNGRADVGTFS